MNEKGRIMTFSLCLKTRRTSKGLSISALAKQSGVSAAYLRILEKGVNPSTGKRVRPSMHVLEKIGNVLFHDVKELYAQIDEEELSYFGIQRPRSSILEEAERRLSTQRKLLLEQIALAFMEAETKNDELSVESFPVMDEMGLANKTISLEGDYHKAINVFTDVSYPPVKNCELPYFCTSCCVYEGKKLLGQYAGRFVSTFGQKNGEAYAAWLGFLQGIRARQGDQKINLFMDQIQFVELLRLLGNENEKLLAKRLDYGIALHFVKKIGEENIPFRIWAVKSHLKAVTPASVEKQALYFYKRNGVPISRSMARLLCDLNGTADKLARDAIYDNVSISHEMNRLQTDIFEPLEIAQECWNRFFAIMKR